MRGNSTVYVVSAGRPQCKTASLLEKLNYPGDWYICVSCEDEALPEYLETWGSKVLTYSYTEQMKRTDMLDPFDDPIGGAAPARNGVAYIASQNGDRRYWMLDDDLTAFTLPKKESMSRRTVKDGTELETAFRLIADWAEDCGIPCVGGTCDMQSFPPSKWDVNWYVRGMYNLSCDAPKFRSRMEEDLCYACDSYRDKRAFCIALKAIGFRTGGVGEEQGGCTTVYEKNGTIRRAAYNILVSPLSVVKEDRFEYSGFPKWKNVVPKMLNEKFAKE